MLDLFQKLFSVLGLLLLLSGDIELNPGPPKQDTQSKQLDAILQLLHELNTCSATPESQFSKLDKGQNELMIALKAVQQSQEDIDNKLSGISLKIGAVERLHAVNLKMRSALYDMEDQSRRNNLVFHGLMNCPSVNWAQSEQRILRLISDELHLDVTGDRIERAHRIGSFKPEKPSPILVKFASFKTRDLVFQSRSKLQSKLVSISQDFSARTRHLRNRLINYGKTLNVPFTVRYDKLYVNGECFDYDSDMILFEKVCPVFLRR